VRNIRAPNRLPFNARNQQIAGLAGEWLDPRDEGEGSRIGEPRLCQPHAIPGC
jgi:hypothetical protein